jgi:hypothetical protein
MNSSSDAGVVDGTGVAFALAAGAMGGAWALTAPASSDRPALRDAHPVAVQMTAMQTAALNM